MENITIKTNPSITAFYKTQLYLYITKPFVMGIYIFLLILIISKILNLIGYDFLTARSDVSSFLAFLVVFYVGLPLGVYFRTKRYWKNSPSSRIYQFTNDIISITDEINSFRSEYKWISTIEIVELKNSVLIYLDPTSIRFIPKKAFTDIEFNSFKKMALTKIGGNYRVGAIKKHSNAFGIILLVNLLLMTIFIPKPKKNNLSNTGTDSIKKTESIIKLNDTLEDKEKIEVKD